MSLGLYTWSFFVFSGKNSESFHRRGDGQKGVWGFPRPLRGIGAWPDFAMTGVWALSPHARWCCIGPAPLTAKHHGRIPELVRLYVLSLPNV